MSFRIGCDPEVFLTQNDKFKSAIGLIGRGKHNPLQVEDMAEGFTFQEDNVAVEFGVPPAKTSDEFVFNVKAVQEKFLTLHPEFTFSKLNCVSFPFEELMHPMAQMFGCEPDYNAWNGKKNLRPTVDDANLRSAGGHVHVETTLNKKEVVRCLDLILGVPSILMDEGKDRRKLYGKAGAFRPKSYGVEYRTLSNFWIFDEKYIRWVWNGVERALEFVEEGKAAELAFLKHEIVSCINRSDKAAAQIFVDTFNLEVV